MKFLLKGTFESGDSKEEIAYGLVTNIHTFNPVYIQVCLNKIYAKNGFDFLLHIVFPL